MTWQKDTIRLGAAQRIFPQFNIEAETLPGAADVVVGYSAKINSVGTMTDISLTSLCSRIVGVLFSAYEDSRPAAVQKLKSADESQGIS